MLDFGTVKASSIRRLTFKQKHHDTGHPACLHIDPRVDNTHLSSQDIIIRIITEAQILQSQALLLCSPVIELLIVPLSPFFNLPL